MKLSLKAPLEGITNLVGMISATLMYSIQKKLRILGHLVLTLDRVSETPKVACLGSSNLLSYIVNACLPSLTFWRALDPIPYSRMWAALQTAWPRNLSVYFLFFSLDRLLYFRFFGRRLNRLRLRLRFQVLFTPRELRTRC